MSVNVVPEESCALLVVHHHDLDTEFAEPLVAAGEGSGLANNECSDVELSYEARAVPAGGQRGNHDRVAVVASPAGSSEGVGFGVDGGVVVLYSAVMAPSENLAVTSDEGGPDGYAPFGESEARLFEGDVENASSEGGVEGCGHALSIIERGER